MNKLTVCLLAALAITFTGCIRVEKSIATIAYTVDGAMKGWATWVVQGNATEDQQLEVRAAYSKYQASMNTVRVAYSAYKIEGTKSALELFDHSLEQLEANQLVLLDLIKAFSKK